MAKSFDELVEMHKKGINLVGKIEKQYPYDSKFSRFLESAFPSFRFLIIQTKNNYKDRLIKELEKFIDYRKLDSEILNVESLTYDDIVGEIEVYEDKELGLCHRRKKPFYWPDKDKMIILENLNTDTDLEAIRAIVRVAQIEDYYINDEKLPDDKLPYGSGLVIFCDDIFPKDKFDRVSSYWRDCTRYFNYNETIECENKL